MGHRTGSGDARRLGVRIALSASILLAIGGCADIYHTRIAEGEAPTVFGPAVRNNATPLDSAYRCYGSKLEQAGVQMSVGVSEIRDYTGQYSDLEGTVVTQGGPLMAYSALGKLGQSVQLHERFDVKVAELELAYMDRRQLGDGQPHQVNGQQVPWKPYFGGTIIQSDYFIVGGITEVNYNIQSGGIQGSADLIGPKARTFTLSIAVDLRMVDTQSLLVVATSSLQKQIVGYEVGFEIFRFFSDTLVDVNLGAKNQEPIQLGVRTAIELGLLDLLGKTTGVFYQDCVADYFEDPSVIGGPPPSADDQGAESEKIEEVAVIEEEPPSEAEIYGAGAWAAARRE